MPSLRRGTAQPLDSFVFPSSARSLPVQSSPGQDAHIRKIVEQCLHAHCHEQQNLSRRVAHMEGELSRLSSFLGVRDDIAQPNADSSVHAPFQAAEHQYACLERKPHEEHPESMLCYCVAMCTSDAGHGQLFPSLTVLAAVAWLMSSLSHILCTGNASLEALDKMIPVSRKEQPLQMACLYQGRFTTSGIDADPMTRLLEYPKVLNGEPWCDIIISLCCVLLLCFSIRGDDAQLLTSSQCFRYITGPKWFAVCFFVYVTVVCNAMLIITGTVSSMSRSSNIVDKILSSVAAGFLLQIDDMLYQEMLSGNQKREYHRILQTMLNASAEAQTWALSWILFVLNLGSAIYQLAAHFSLVEASNSMLYGQVAARGLAVAYCIAWNFGSIGVNSHMDGHGTTSFTTFAKLISKACVLNAILYIFCVVYTFFTIFWWSYADTRFDAPAVRECIRGQNITACYC